ncbi:MAG: phytoene desaturase [Prolixibacteraceae bacterium]|nr:phytoene desaturase [Prolixibacteraceae bacterium]
MSKKVIIAGAGLGGIATALRLSSQGYQVQILEKNHQAGGRLNQIKKDGFTFDTGPSFFSMSYEFTAFAKDCKIDLPFDYVELDPLYTVNFGGSPKTYYLYKDLKKLAAQFEGIEPDFEGKMRKYLHKCSRIFHDTVDVVIKQNFDSLFEYAKALTSVNMAHIPVLFRKFDQQVNRYFQSNEARQIVSLVAFFLGRTPFDTSAIYTLLSYTEFQHDGYYNVKGGMYKIVEGIVKELERRAVDIVYNTEIVDYKARGNQLLALVDQHNNEWEADAFVINADAAVFRGKIFNREAYSIEKLDKKEWTMGYLTIYLGIEGKLPQANHHNYFIGNNFSDYATDVYKNPDRLQKPYYYVNVLSKHNAECAPEGCESLFIVCPVPDLRYKPNWDDKDEIVNSIVQDFSERIGVNIADKIVSRTIYTPEDWQSQFNLHRGSGLGLSHNLWQIGGLRPKNYDEIYQNTFYTGASTIPGAGLPMAIISSKLATERVLNYLTS